MKMVVEVTKLVDYIEKLRSAGTFQIRRTGPPSDNPADEHIGAIIVDATLASPRHNYNRQVKKRVRNVRTTYPSGATTSGFLELIRTVGLGKLLMGWEEDSSKKLKQAQVKDTAEFFAKEGIETFQNLLAWIKKAKNRDKLKRHINGIGDKTADYYAVLVRDPDAVAVDERICTFLKNAGIDESKYSYKDKKTIVQKAARRMGCAPLDLEQSIWHSNPENSQRGAKMGEKNSASILRVSLQPAKLKQLEAVAREEYGEEPENLAKFWIIERLQLHQVEKPQRSPKMGSSSTVAPITITGQVGAPDGEENPRREIGRICKSDLQRVTCKGGHLDLSTVKSKFAAEWNDDGTVLLIPIKLSLGSQQYDATFHYRASTGRGWIGSPLNDRKVKLAGPLASQGFKKGDLVNLTVQGNNIQVNQVQASKS
jgi:thermostable 8-oxoguanine DNA glycosylase